jgi:hypothetical protein
MDPKQIETQIDIVDHLIANLTDELMCLELDRKALMAARSIQRSLREKSDHA